MRRLFRHPLTWVVLSVAVVALAVGLYLFQPWRLWTRSHVDEAVPTAAPQVQQPVQPADDSSSGPATPPPAPRNEVLAEGTFVSGEHETGGTARVLRLADGSRVLRLENFSTSDGPDVHVWLTDQPAGGPWGSYDDGRHVALGKMKATDGNQNYPIPADADLTGLRSVAIWCDRFNVVFGSAPVVL
jgi:Electron transfer DM13